MTSFDSLGLPDPLLSAIRERGYEEPTPIQAQAIPVILEGRDLVGSSQTGTGKTAAFALPSLAQIHPIGKPQILVLEPTRELAEQVAEQFRFYGKHTDLKITVIYGGVGYEKQEQEIQSSDIVVATPGRLVDHFYRATMRFGKVSILILDEVDRMLDMGFLPIVRKIVNLCPWTTEGEAEEQVNAQVRRYLSPAKRQTLLFSATMPAAIETFARWCLNDPAQVEIARREVASTVRHAFYPVAMSQRDEFLLALLKRTDFENIMIFTRTRKEADQLFSLLKKNGYDQSAVMHSDIRQNDRNKALQGFKDGTFRILVATDVAARGLDISGVTHVINYRVPENAEDYVHRIGRTGRAKSEGEALTLLTADELDFAQSIESFINQSVKRVKIEGFPYAYTALLDDSPKKAVRKRRPPPPKRRR